MKKSQIVTITILAASLASCHRKSNRQDIHDWNNTNSYVSTDGGNSYQQGSSGFPYWFYWYMMSNNRGTYTYYPGAVYHGYAGRYHSGMHSTTRSSFAGRSSSVRGGFGSSGRSAGS